MRARAHNGHAPLQYVEELGQFVKAGAAQEGTQAGNARVARAGLGDQVGAFVVHFHGPEFVHLEPAAIDAHAVLLENDRPG